MHSVEFINAVEDRYTHRPKGEPTLGNAFTLWQSRWTSGAQDRETALRLMFLAWYAHNEPPFLTGLMEVGNPKELLGEIFAFLGGENSNDAEFLFVAGYMVSLSSWCFGSEVEWNQQGELCLNRWREIVRRPIDLAIFDGRGAYGEYFAHIARSNWADV